MVLGLVITKVVFSWDPKSVKLDLGFAVLELVKTYIYGFWSFLLEGAFGEGTLSDVVSFELGGGVLGEPSQCGRFVRGQNIEHWCRWNKFQPRPLIPWHLPRFWNLCWWFDYLVGRLNCFLNSGVHRLSYEHNWQIGMSHFHGLAISYHLPRSILWPWVGRRHNLVVTTHLCRFLLFIWNVMTLDLRGPLAWWSQQPVYSIGRCQPFMDQGDLFWGKDRGCVIGITMLICLSICWSGPAVRGVLWVFFGALFCNLWSVTGT